MKKKIFVIILPLFAFIFCYIISILFLFFTDVTNFICPVKLVTGFLCPGCGATRALRSLLELNFMESLKNNPTIIIFVLCIIVSYIQLFFNTFGIRKKIIPENKLFYFVFTGIIFTYLVLRNFIPAIQPL